MKPLLTSILLVCSQLLFAQPETVTLHDSQLQGRVKSVTETSYSTVEKFGILEKDSQKKKTASSYNKAGFLTELKSENFELKYKHSEFYKFDSKNKLLQFRTEDDGAVRVRKIKYNSTGNIIEMDIVDEKGSLENKHKFEYAGNIKLENKELASLLEYEQPEYVEKIYTHSGKLDEIKIQLSGQEMFYNGFYTWKQTNRKTLDDAGKMTEQEILTPDKSITINCTYNNAGKMVKYSRQVNDTEPVITNYIYNANGDLEKESTFNAGLVSEYSYIYDSRKNWVKKIESHSSSTYSWKRIVERQIKYY